MKQNTKIYNSVVTEFDDSNKFPPNQTHCKIDFWFSGKCD